MTTLLELHEALVAHTDAGDFLQLNGELKAEFVLPGSIVKERAGLFFVNIEDEKFSVHKQEGFSLGEEVHCILRFHITDGKKCFVIKSLEKI